MNVSRTTLFFCAMAMAVSLGCVRLGFWQLRTPARAEDDERAGHRSTGRSRRSL